MQIQPGETLSTALNKHISICKMVTPFNELILPFRIKHWWNMSTIYVALICCQNYLIVCEKGVMKDTLKLPPNIDSHIHSLKSTFYNTAA